MCSFATGAGSRVMTSAVGCGRVRGVTFEKKLISAHVLFSYFTRSVYKILAVVSLKSAIGLMAYVLCEDPAWTTRVFNSDTSAARARTSFVILLERLVSEIGTPVLRL